MIAERSEAITVMCYAAVPRTFEIMSVSDVCSRRISTKWIFMYNIGQSEIDKSYIRRAPGNDLGTQICLVSMVHCIARSHGLIVLADLIGEREGESAG